MEDKHAKLLHDILNSGSAIQSFVAQHSFEGFQADLLVRSGVERQFEIIGEAMRRLSTLDATFAARVTRSREIVAFRNLIAHGYDVVDYAVVWGIIADDLPSMIDEVRALLAELEAS